MSEFNLHEHPAGEKPEEEAFHEHGLQRKLGGIALGIVIAIALVFSIYQLIVAAFSPLSSLVNVLP